MTRAELLKLPIKKKKKKECKNLLTEVDQDDKIINVAGDATKETSKKMSKKTEKNKKSC